MIAIAYSCIQMNYELRRIYVSMEYKFSLKEVDTWRLETGQ
jgi:hypothetical protein